MGIFDLFKPSPEELKAKEDAARAQVFIENKEWDQVVEIGKPAVKPLISCLKDNYALDIVIPATRTLGRIGNANAINQLQYFYQRGTLPEPLSIEPTGYDWDYYNALMPIVAEALTNIGKSDVEQITKFVKKDECLFLDGIPFIWALCEIGDRKATEDVIRWMFRVEPNAPILSFGTPLLYQEKLLSHSDIIRKCIPPTVLPKLLGDYSDLILDTFAWELVSFSGEPDSLQVDTSRCNGAIQRLCEIKTPISNNILLMISKIDKFNVGYQHGTHESETAYVDFKPFQQMTKEELKSRGNPSYNPSAYLEEEVWKL